MKRLNDRRPLAAQIEASLKNVDPRRPDVGLRRFDRDHGRHGIQSEDAIILALLNA